MKGKRGLIMGVANDYSIAWGIAQALHAAGAELAFTYLGDPILKRLEPLAKEVGSDILIPCDAGQEEQVDAAFAALAKRWPKIDFIVHSLAFSDKNELKGRFIDTTQDNFKNTMIVSCYSFVSCLRRAAPMMSDGGSAITLSYYGAEKVMPNYNVMGVAKAALEASVRYLAADVGADNIRVNAISAGPMRTLAGSAIGGAKATYRAAVETSPMKRPMTLEDIGGAALYLLSDMASGVTGEIHYVDGGYNVMGMKKPDTAANGDD
ncbi:MAG: enoyl-ACP reductase [Rhodospirillales bacterium]|nr:enoyl-ACP reductase [Alphaproteobacteria bacterium]MCB9987468.1 enoyl-ACP reductase [Rhodospirillales bacterium]USO08649.1 MAG: enoyl-ACP reductase [Rhodospirillales bacterium]